ncbi:MAG: RNA polymerase sigma factor [Phycisphaerales bacterium JB047]
MRIYWPAVYAYLRRNGHGQESAAELTQSFFHKKVLNGKLFERFDAERGRLRSLILRSLKNHLVDEHRAEESRGKQARVHLDFGGIEESYDSEQHPDELFEQRWATAQLEEAVRRCEAYFRSSGRDGHWEAFCDRIYHPVINATTATAYSELAPRLGFRSAADAAAAVQLVKRRVTTFLREVVMDTLRDTDEAQSEFERITQRLGIR